MKHHVELSMHINYQMMQMQVQAHILNVWHGRAAKVGFLTLGTARMAVWKWNQPHEIFAKRSRQASANCCKRIRTRHEETLIGTAHHLHR
jgi:hypothetical protein